MFYQNTPLHTDNLESSQQHISEVFNNKLDIHVTVSTNYGSR